MGDRTNATLLNTLNYFSRIQTFVVRTNPTTSGMGAAGAIVSGLLMFGAVLALTSTSRIGMVAGAVVGAATVAMIVAAGLAPSWVWALVLAVLALVLPPVVIRGIR